jgi:hypothetical protein
VCPFPSDSRDVSFAHTRLLAGAFLFALLLAIAPAAQAQVIFGDFPQVITDQVEGAEKVFAVDLDRDGDLDVLFSAPGGASYFSNDGAGVFSGSALAVVPTSGLADVAVADFDGTGGPDVAFVSNGGLGYAANDGSGNFTLQEITGSGFGSDSRLAASDMNGDGTQDIVLSSGNAIGLILNEGAGAFGDVNLFEPGSASPTLVESLVIADLDGDGAKDDVISAVAGEGTIGYYLNDLDNGEGIDPRRVITDQADFVPDEDPAAFSADLFSVDLDGDGDEDILSASAGDNAIAYYLNDLGNSGGFTPRQVITSEALSVSGVFASDLDGDGAPDVLSASFGDDTVAFYRNDGTGTFGPRRVITDQADGAEAVVGADLDGDGDPDVLSASSIDNTIAAYENLTPPLRLVTPASVTPGQAFTAEVVFGPADPNDVLVIDDPPVLGASFVLTYEDADLEGVTAGDVTAGPFLTPASGTDATPLFDVTLPPGEASIAVGTTRKRTLTYPAVVEPVTLARVTFQVAPDAVIGETINFSFRDFLAIDIGGVPVPVAGIDASIEIVEEALVVWPGDADNSGAVDPAAVAVEATDLLPIGLCFGVSGPPRPGDFNISWNPQNATEFGFPPVAGDPCQDGAAGPQFTDPAFADGTGDGVVDARDILPIGANFELARNQTGTGDPRTQQLPARLAAAKSGGGPALRLPAPEAGQTYPLAISLGEPAQDLFGVAARLRFPPGLFDLEEVGPGTFLDNGDMLSISEYDSETGVLEVAFTRKRGAGAASGTGDVAEVVLSATRTSSVPASIRLEEVVASRLGRGTAAVRSPVLTSPLGLEVPAVFRLKAPAPNPTTGAARLAYQLSEAADVRMALYDALGREIAVLIDQRLEAGPHEHVLETRGLAAGLYFYRLTAGSHTATKKLTVVR